METPQDRAYSLGQYEIIEGWDGAIRWETHAGLAGLKGGRCLLEGNVLVLGPPEIEKAGFFKTEFLGHLRRLPQWQKTPYYCHSHALHNCKTARSISFGSKIGSTDSRIARSSGLENKSRRSKVKTRLQHSREKAINKGRAGIHAGELLKSWLERLRSR